jgi:phosphatidylserine/phosphatidylglycerophosphate/cardiolipin synthase-like enzyme
MEALLELSPQIREKLIAKLRNGDLVPPYGGLSLKAILGGDADTGRIEAALNELEELGIRKRGAAEFIRVAAKARDEVIHPQLVWTGPELKGNHARDTRQVFEEMMGSAERSLWASTYVYWDGPKIFQLLAQRMNERPELEVTLLMNMPRDFNDPREAAVLVESFRERFWRQDWPNPHRAPRLFYYPEALETETSKKGVLHAKALVKDEEEVFITSANFTAAALDRNIELGVKIRDLHFGRQVIKHFKRMIELGRLAPLVPPPA